MRKPVSGFSHQHPEIIRTCRLRSIARRFDTGGSEDEHCRPSGMLTARILNDVQVESVTENRLTSPSAGPWSSRMSKFRVGSFSTAKKRSGFISPSASLEFSVPTSRRRFGYV